MLTLGKQCISANSQSCQTRIAYSSRRQHLQPDHQRATRLSSTGSLWHRRLCSGVSQTGSSPHLSSPPSITLTRATPDQDQSRPRPTLTKANAAADWRCVGMRVQCLCKPIRMWLSEYDGELRIQPRLCLLLRSSPRRAVCPAFAACLSYFFGFCMC